VGGAAAKPVFATPTTPGQWNRLSPTLERAVTSFDASA
jgi:hypothetical protein